MASVARVAGALLRSGVLILRDERDLGRLHARAAGAGCVFVPTMGALHEGHAALVRAAVGAARERLTGAGGPRAGGVTSPVVVSVFVNPTQFNEKSDFDRYPRDLERDAAMCAAAGATAVFAPSVEMMYPAGVEVPVPALPDVATKPGLEDAFRPGHFAGVCQVVLRLFRLVKPTIAIFGEKDWQQLAVVRAMSREQGLGIDVRGLETVREPDGLAMSSRNVFLTAEDRRRALAISRALQAARGVDSPEAGEAAMRGVLAGEGIEPEYAVVRDATTLGAYREGEPGRALIAARVGKVRLIDNAAWRG
jgi:pantoate--beta-alanine ligase